MRWKQVANFLFVFYSTFYNILNKRKRLINWHRYAESHIIMFKPFVFSFHSLLLHAKRFDTSNYEWKWYECTPRMRKQHNSLVQEQCNTLHTACLRSFFFAEWSTILPEGERIVAVPLKPWSIFSAYPSAGYLARNRPLRSERARPGVIISQFTTLRRM